MRNARSRWVAPPNWPQPEPGWRPPAGWLPQPAWGPAPDGWQFEQSGPTPEQGAPWYRKRWVPPVAAGLVGLILGAASAGGGEADLRTQLAAQQTESKTLQQEVEVTSGQVASLNADVAKAKGEAAAAKKEAGDAKGAALADLKAETDKLAADRAAALKEAGDAKGAALAELKAVMDKIAAERAALEVRAKAVGAAEAQAAANTFPGDGVFVVGDDVQPGTYKSAGGSGCYWGRQDRNGETIANELGDGPTVVTIQKSDFAIKVARCAPFTKTR